MLNDKKQIRLTADALVNVCTKSVSELITACHANTCDLICTRTEKKKRFITRALPSRLSVRLSHRVSRVRLPPAEHVG